MDRRTLLKTLVALPMVQSVEVARIRPDDVVVIQCASVLDDEAFKRIQEAMKRIFPPGTRVAILDAGLSMKIARKEP